MLTIKCAECGEVVFRYVKIGKGRLLHCWKARITEDNSVRNGMNVRCKCGNLIGTEERRWVKMRSHAFITSGTALKKK